MSHDKYCTCVRCFLADNWGYLVSIALLVVFVFLALPWCMLGAIRYTAWVGEVVVKEKD